MTKRARDTKNPQRAQPAAPASAFSGAGRAHRTSVAVVLILYLALATAYVFRLPIDAAPDESAHRVYVGWLAENRRLPVFDPADAQHYELHQPPLYYALCLPAYYAAGGGRDVARLTHAVRFVNVLLGLVVVLLAFVFAGHLAPHRPWAAVGAAAFVAFLPMQLVLCASINNDVLSQALTTGVLCLLVGQVRAGRVLVAQERRGSRKRGRDEHPEWRAAAGSGFTARRMALVGVLAALALLTKSQAVFLAPVIWLAALAAVGNGDITLRRALALAALATGVMLALAGWWLLRNKVLYGDPLAMGVFLKAFVGSRPTPEKMMGQMSPIAYVVFWVPWWTFHSFWGMFGPDALGRFVFYPSWCYWVLFILSGAALVGLARWLLSPGSAAPWQRRALLAPGLLGLLVIASLVRFNFTFFQAQGRYLFPALALWAFLFVVGLTHHAPARARAPMTIALSALMLLLAAGGLAVMGALGG